MIITKQDIIDSALALVREPASAPDYAPDLKDVYEKNFNSAFRKILGRRSWSFFIRKARLVGREDVSEDEDFVFSYRFGLPEGFLRPFGVSVSLGDFNTAFFSRIYALGNDYQIPDLSDFEIHGNYLYSNQTNVFMVFQHNNLEKAGAINPSFVTAFEYCLAAYFAISVKDAPKLKESYIQLFEREVNIAINADDMSVRRENEGRAYGGLL